MTTPTPIELWQQLKDMVFACERDANKATRGMKAGGVRLRAAMQDIRDMALELRKAVLEHRSNRTGKKRKDEPVVVLADAKTADENVFEPASVGGDDAIAAGAEALDSPALAAPAKKEEKPEADNTDSRYIPYWYSSFSY